MLLPGKEREVDLVLPVGQPQLSWKFPVVCLQAAQSWPCGTMCCPPQLFGTKVAAGPVSTWMPPLWQGDALHHLTWAPWAAKRLGCVLWAIVW